MLLVLLLLGIELCLGDFVESRRWLFVWPGDLVESRSTMDCRGAGVVVSTAPPSTVCAVQTAGVAGIDAVPLTHPCCGFVVRRTGAGAEMNTVSPKTIVSKPCLQKRNLVSKGSTCLRLGIELSVLGILVRGGGGCCGGGPHRRSSDPSGQPLP